MDDKNFEEILNIIKQKEEIESIKKSDEYTEIMNELMDINNNIHAYSEDERSAFEYRRNQIKLELSKKDKEIENKKQVVQSKIENIKRDIMQDSEKLANRMKQINEYQENLELSIKQQIEIKRKEEEKDFSLQDIDQIKQCDDNLRRFRETADKLNKALMEVIKNRRINNEYLEYLSYENIDKFKEIIDKMDKKKSESEVELKQEESKGSKKGEVSKEKPGEEKGETSEKEPEEKKGEASEKEPEEKKGEASEKEPEEKKGEASEEKPGEEKGGGALEKNTENENKSDDILINSKNVVELLDYYLRYLGKSKRMTDDIKNDELRTAWELQLDVEIEYYTKLRNYLVKYSEKSGEVSYKDTKEIDIDSKTDEKTLEMLQRNIQSALAKAGKNSISELEEEAMVELADKAFEDRQKKFEEKWKKIMENVKKGDSRFENLKLRFPELPGEEEHKKPDEEEIEAAWKDIKSWKEEKTGDPRTVTKKAKREDKKRLKSHIEVAKNRMEEFKAKGTVTEGEKEDLEKLLESIIKLAEETKDEKAMKQANNAKKEWQELKSEVTVEDETKETSKHSAEKTPIPVEEEKNPFKSMFNKAKERIDKIWNFFANKKQPEELLSLSMVPEDLIEMYGKCEKVLDKDFDKLSKEDIKRLEELRNLTNLNKQDFEKARKEGRAGDYTEDDKKALKKAEKVTQEYMIKKCGAALECYDARELIDLEGDFSQIPEDSKVYQTFKNVTHMRKQIDLANGNFVGGETEKEKEEAAKVLRNCVNALKGSEFERFFSEDELRSIRVNLAEYEKNRKKEQKKEMEPVVNEKSSEHTEEISK